MKSSTEIKKIAKDTVALEAKAIQNLENSINDDFVAVIELIMKAKGRLIVAGHGDLGNVQKGDIVLCISKSGNTPEIKAILPFIKNMGNSIIGLTGNMNSFLAKESDFALDVSVEKEACPNNLAPTTSTTAQLVMGDALAVTLLACKNFTDKDFARFHPGGTLGKRLYLKLSDILNENSNPSVNADATINQVIIEISKKCLGATAVLENNILKGIITDGDLRRMLEKGDSFSTLTATDIMCVNPKTIDINTLAYDTLQLMDQNNISQMIVMDNANYVGIVHIHEIIREGVV